MLVNDDSADASEEVCIGLFQKYSGVIRFYSLSKNVGEHNAVMAGLNKVTGDYALIMDDDFQNPVSEVVKLVDVAVKHQYDVVYSYYGKKRHSLFRNMGTWFNDQVANMVLNKPKGLYLSSFKVISRFLVKEIVHYRAPFPYIDGMILQITDNIGTVKVEHRDRRVGHSGYNLPKLVSLWSNMLTNFSILPLRVSVFLGFFFSLIGVIFGISTIFEKISNPDLPVGYAAVIVAICFFVGIQLLVLGMVGEYVGRIFLCLNRKPQFTIKKSFEADADPP